MKLLTTCLVIMGLWATTAGAQTTPLDGVLKEINYTEDTLRSLFDFVAMNIDYDLKMVAKIPEYKNREEILVAAIKRRKGICEHYAELLHQLLLHHGYDSHLVSGYTKENGRINTEFGHTWNAVRLDNGWYLMDATWAAGYVEDMKFYKKYDPSWYLVEPAKMLETHFPYDPVWQLTEYPISHEAIKKGAVDQGQTMEKIDYDSIITAEKSMDNGQVAERVLQRIKAAGVTNRLILTRIKFLELELASANAKNDVDRINQGVDFMNDAVVNFNAYMKAKQQGFKGKEWTPEKLEEHTSYIKEQLRQASMLFSSVSIRDPKITANLRDLKRNTSKMMQDIDREIDFLNKKFMNSN